MFFGNEAASGNGGFSREAVSNFLESLGESGRWNHSLAPDGVGRSRQDRKTRTNAKGCNT
jgi:hypothetical protein